MQFLLLFLLLSTSLLAQDEARLLRFPAIHGDKIAFSYAGDLYLVSSSGGTARKITTDIGYEMFPRFSPDGKFIAFTGQYDGNTEVYLVNSEGGIPKRLTYTATLDRDDVSDRMGPNNIVMSWRDNNNIVYRSRWREFNDFKGQLYQVSKEGGLSDQLPLPRGGFCSFSPDGQKMAYNRVFREFRTWKRYKGGMADDVWIYDFKTKKHENITNNPAQDIIPMWGNNKIYFTSERDGKLNLYSYDLNSKETKKHTSFTEFDVKFPSIGDNAIVFENGGFIYKFDLKTEKAEKVKIYIYEDFAVGRGGLIDVSKSITNYEISPDGKRAIFGSRGDIFTVPAKNGAVVNLTGTPGIHERSSKWSPDGKWIAYISDVSGEDEVYIRPAAGGEEIQLTKKSDSYKYSVLWSPDSKKLLFNDKMQKLSFVDIESKKVTQIDKATQWEITVFDWSHDSRYVVYTRPEENEMANIYIYSMDDAKINKITDGWFGNTEAVFSEDGRFLYLVSQRSFSPTYSWTEWNHIYQDMAKLYLITLSKDTKSPFEPKSDEVSVSDTTKKADEKKDSKTPAKLNIDFAGISNRIIEIPVTPSNYRNLGAADKKLYYLRRGTRDERTKMFAYDVDKQKETELGEVDGYEISADKKKMLIGQGGSYSIIDLPSGKIEAKERLNLSDMKVKLDRQAEWTQIYNEAWRQMRDFLYAPNMHGVDWEKIKTTYAPIVKHVNHRADLSYIIGEMIGELNIGHAYVGGGDYPAAKRIKLGLLGAMLEKDKSGYFKIKKIWQGANWDKTLRSPLTEIGVNAKEGDFIVAVNGKSTKDVADIYELFVNTAGKQVKLKVNGKASEDGAVETTVIPVGDEQPLLYYNWVQNNIRKVTEATNGKVGYIHIPDMSPEGLNQFVKHYYPQTKKDALIIDVRGNGGGNVSPMIIERLRRELAMIDIARNTATSYDPNGMHYGPKVAMLDEYSASDGDIFPFRFKHYKLGKLVGKRSWGGTVGIRGSLPFLDGGYLNRPEFASYTVDGKDWAIEGYGVDPDIYVDNDPALEFEGVDQQLNKAIEVALEELKTFKKLPPPPPYPDKK
ncbi:MAG: PD40 domain-containing protein [Ignavibacteriaceae bacterium]|nr:PD40 domain-containing protein [Ignavibacteriaceae bacterium]